MSHGSLISTWADVRRLTLAVARTMPADRYGFRPTPETMSFAEQLLHIALAEQTLLEAAQTGAWRWDRDLTTRRYPDRDAVVRLLEDQGEEMRAYLAGLPPAEWERPRPVPWGGEPTLAELVLDWIVHEAHHRGQLVVYLRLSGLQPPPYN